MVPVSTLGDTKRERTLSRFLRRALFQKVRSNKCVQVGNLISRLTVLRLKQFNSSLH